MIEEIKKLQLPFGKWQEYARDLLTNSVLVPKELNIECNYPDSRTVEFVIVEVARFKLSFLYGCKAILVSHDTFIYPEYRGIGISGILQLIKHRIARDLAVKLLFATAVETNEREQQVLAKWGWSSITKFVNPRTQHEVGFFIKHLD